MTTAIPDKVDLRKYIEMRNDRPHIRGRKLPIAFVASAERENKMSVAELAYDFTLTEEQVLAALLYYREHKEEIDAQDVEDIRMSDETARRHSKKPGQS